MAPIMIPVMGSRFIDDPGAVWNGIADDYISKTHSWEGIGELTGEGLFTAATIGIPVFNAIKEARIGTVGGEVGSELRGNVGLATQEGEFSIFNWEGYPNGPRPTGPFRILNGEEYKAARDLANSTNASIHNANPSLKEFVIHEIHPVKFGGSPTDISNKLFVTPTEHLKYTIWWRKILNTLR